MSYVGKVNTGQNDHLVAATVFGTCSTAADVAAKIAVLDNFDALMNGVTIQVKFVYSNTALNPTLNVNNTGAKPIYLNGTNPPGSTALLSWSANSVLSFTYDGTAWIMNDVNKAVVDAVDRLNAGYNPVSKTSGMTKAVGNDSEGKLWTEPVPAADVQTAANTWLSANITNPDSPPLDRSLSSNVSAAPADMVGDLRNTLTNNSILMLMGHDASPKVSNGVTFTYNSANNTFTVNGTTTAIASFRFLSTSADVPAYIEPGGSYYLKYRTTDANIRFNCMYLVNGTWQYIDYTKDVVFTIPSTATGIGFRLAIDSGKTISNAIVTASLQSISFDKISTNLDLFKLCGQYPYTAGTSHGITFAYNTNTDIFTVNGTSTEDAYFRLFGTDDEVPFFIKQGETYLLRYNTTDDNVRCQYMYLVGSEWTYAHYSGDAIITIPDNATDFGFRLRVLSGKTISNAIVSASLHLVTETKIVGEKLVSDSIALIANNEEENVFELYTNFEKNAGWWELDGTVDSSGTHKHTQKLAIRPNTTYYTGYIIDGYDCYGVFYDYNGNTLAFLTSAMITEHQYKLPDGTGTQERSSYSPMFKFTSPDNAYYISFNFSSLKNSVYNYTYRSYLASKPIFATNLYGDLVIRKNDPVWNKFHNRKLCVIGTSQIMIDRLTRTGKFDDINTDETQYVSGVQEYLMPWYDTVDSYGYSSAAMMYIPGETTKSIYTRVVTDQLDLSGYDDYFITHSSSELTANNIGDITSYSDLGSNETFIGALRQIIDYIYTQNPKANVFVQTRIIRAAFNGSSYYQNTIAANEKVRKLAKLLSLTCVDTAEESGFNYYVAPYWCYDNNGHPNQLGNYYIGLAMRKTIIGI